MCAQGRCAPAEWCEWEAVGRTRCPQSLFDLWTLSSVLIWRV